MTGGFAVIIVQNIYGTIKTSWEMEVIPEDNGDNVKAGKCFKAQKCSPRMPSMCMRSLAEPH